MTRHLSIRVLAPFMLMLPVVVVSAVILVVSSQSAERAAERLAYDELEQIQSTIADRVDALVLKPPRVTTLNTDLLDQARVDQTNPEGWADLMVSQAKAFPSLSSVAWGGADGSATWVARYGRGQESKLLYALLTAEDQGMMREYPVDADGTIANNASSTFEFNPKVRPWYRGAVEAGQGTWSEPYAWAGDTDGGVTLGLSYSCPYPGDGKPLVGVLSADLNLDDIAMFLDKLKIGENGICYIVDDRGRLIASSTDVRLVDEEGELWAAGSAPDAQIAAAASHWSQLPQSDGGIQREKHNASGKVMYTTRSPVGKDAGLHWTVITTVPEDDFLADARRAQRTSLLIGLGVVVITLFGGLFIARWLSKPVLSLEAHARKVGEGDFDSKIELTQSTEFDRLSATLNHMSTDLRERVELRRSLATAMQVQQSLLPQSLPQITGLDIAGTSLYCDQTGGDYYDFLALFGDDENSLAIVVGDVMGHGIAAAMLMATARGILRSRSCEPGSTGEILAHLNDQLNEVTQGTRFMTMVMTSVDAITRRMRWASAGHDAPFIYDPSTEQFVELEGGGLPLGVMAGETYDEYETDPLTPGTVIAFVTDGVFEARNQADQMLGKDPIKKLIREHHHRPAQEISDELQSMLDSFRTGVPQDDDITFVILRVLGRKE